MSDEEATNGRRNEALRAKANGVEDFLRQRVIGQEEAVARVAPVLRNAFLGLSEPDRPLASFLLVGPTGVGKTEMAKAIAEYAFADKPLTFDMSEFQLQTGVEIMLGANTHDRGRVGSKVIGQHAGVVNFDEMEKAHVLVLDLFLQLLDEGRLTAATGEAMDFRQFVVTMTSNLGAREAGRMRHAPFSHVERIVRQEVDRKLRPEFQERFGEIVVFRHLEQEAQRKICAMMIAKVFARLRLDGHELEMTPEGTEFLLRRGIDRERGARRLRRTVALYVEGAVASEIGSEVGKKAKGRVTPNATGTALIVR